MCLCHVLCAKISEEGGALTLPPTVIFNPTCSNGILDAGEECDDSNQFVNDGCNLSCRLENSTTFLCVNVTAQGPTECCPALVNPVTQQKVCDCADQVTDNAGYIISRDCKKVNVNECVMGTSVCHRNATCFDKDAALNVSQRYECICPPGMIGDGITSCSVFSYETRFSVVKRGVSLDSFDRAAFKMVLGSRLVVLSWVAENRISIMYSEYTSSGTTGRRLLQATQSPDTQIDVSIFSETVGEMNNITQSTNASLLLDSGYEVSSPASSVTNNFNNADEPTADVSPGFQVESVQFDDKTAQWNVNVRYTSAIPNTITSLYLSKAGTTP
jgi:cysteine-rich repeat protein